MVSRLRTVAFSSMSSAVVLSRVGAHAVLEEASVAAATPRDLLPALVLEAASALRLAQVALEAAAEALLEASALVVALAVVVAVVAVSVATAVSEEEVLAEAVAAVAVLEDTEAVAALATLDLLMVLQPVPAALATAAHTVATAQAAVLTTDAEGVTVDPAVPTTSLSAVGTDTVTETVGMEAVTAVETEAAMGAVMGAVTRVHGNVDTRVTATTTEASEGGTEFPHSCALRRVCQKVTFPLFALPSLSTRLRTGLLVLSHRTTNTPTLEGKHCDEFTLADVRIPPSPSLTRHGRDSKPRQMLVWTRPLSPS
jgi:hypothetical protein